ncbi:ABC transporter ATP-binding protein [Bradyrhizobium sp. CCBAU 11386]|uniref:ABC transporter ATP-binding protein n=1 Tax=Bradyrhizobium sp. CCBAU 11386 TaxID=1630837 RepID=UPI0023028563|nr:ATP-binding cassette domain-containing protein [Bradyrhizobium sp. CCBAU 11386]
MLGIGNLLQRYPRQLSGGQRQRVAIGRAIVRKADLFLFDEPLSNLDAQLRDEMRTEIKRLHHEITTTMIYVTHDQVEAMTLADRIVLLRDGKIEQQGAPLELFEQPRTGFVAGFLVSPSINLVPATLKTSGGCAAVVFQSGGALTLPSARAKLLTGADGQEVLVGIRPQHFSRAGGGPLRDGVVAYSAVADLIQPTGTRTFTTIKIGGVDAVAELQAHDVGSHGERIDLAIDLNRVVLIDPASGLVIS